MNLLKKKHALHTLFIHFIHVVVHFQWMNSVGVYISFDFAFIVSQILVAVDGMYLLRITQTFTHEWHLGEQGITAKVI